MTVPCLAVRDGANPVSRRPNAGYGTVDPATSVVVRCTFGLSSDGFWSAGSCQCDSPDCGSRLRLPGEPGRRRMTQLQLAVPAGVTHHIPPGVLLVPAAATT
jgi:hypothetical protein